VKIAEKYCSKSTLTEIFVYLNIFIIFVLMWIYQNKEINSIGDLPEDVFGFIYLMKNNMTGKSYIGKKQIYSERKTKITKKEQLVTGNKRKKFKQVKKESDWLTYNSSCKEIHEEIKQGQTFEKIILQLCFSKTELTYLEVKYQFMYNVLESDEWYNSNILSKFFKGKLK
jgi:hypothetical protein